MAKLVDARDLKSLGQKCPYRFESCFPYKWPSSPTAEAVDSKSIQCEFESHEGYNGEMVKLVDTTALGIMVNRNRSILV